MSSSEIRNYITLLENTSNRILTEEMIMEGFTDIVKDKAKMISGKINNATGNVLPALTKKVDAMLVQIKSKIGDDAANDFVASMDKKAGKDWRTNIGKVAAAAAVASSLLSMPAQARDMLHQEYPQRREIHRYEEPRHIYVEPRYRYVEPRYHREPGPGEMGAIIFFDALVGTAIASTIINQNQQGVSPGIVPNQQQYPQQYYVPRN